MNWSTFLGGASGEAGFGLRLDGDGDVYVTGACQSNFMTATGYQTTYQGGSLDAYCVKLINDGEDIEFSTYYGTTAGDAAFFLDIDVDGSVYLYGQSDGGIAPVTPGVYSNPLSDQFICKLSDDLETLEFGTVVGMVVQILCQLHLWWMRVNLFISQDIPLLLACPWLAHFIQLEACI